MEITGQIEDEIEQLDQLIRAAEDWAPRYRKNRKIFQKTLKTETKFERILRRYFREFAERLPNYIDWFEYSKLLASIRAADFDIDVVIQDGPIGRESEILINVIYEVVADAATLGAQASEITSGVDIGTSTTSEYIQRTAKEIVALLVGKRVDKDGIIVDNPNAVYRISDTLRRDIKSSVSTSLSLGENQAQAIARMKKVISNPKRAQVIARTESINAYQRGVLAMGLESGAVGKEWESVNPLDICGTNEAQGVIPIKQKFTSGDQAPTAHPNCRCSLRLVYPEDPSASELG